MTTRSGYFVRPTLLLGTDPRDEIFCNEYFGPILSVHVYPDDEFASILTEVDGASPYALTGSIIARDRVAVAQAAEALRFTAGNFYINDKPTGAVVGQQPFGGARASGTNDKAGSAANLMRWTSPRSIKETFVAADLGRLPAPDSRTDAGTSSATPDRWSAGIHRMPRAEALTDYTAVVGAALSPDVPSGPSVRGYAAEIPTESCCSLGRGVGHTSSGFEVWPIARRRPGRRAEVIKSTIALCKAT